MATLTRRALMLRAGEASAIGLAIPLLAACSTLLPAASGGQSATGGGAKSGKVNLPSYVQIQDGPKADLAPRADGVDAGYFTFPQTPFKSVKQKTGNGEDVTLMTNLIQGAVVALEQNPAWQAVNADMGLTVRQRLYGSGDYRNGLATTIAGGDLPDTIYNPPQKYIPNLPAFLQTQCADLTPHLAGDAVKDYPNLANIPTPCWAETVLNGAIYGVPVPRAPFLNAFLVRQDLVDQAQLKLPTSADEFKTFLITLTKAQQNQFGLASAGFFGLAPQSPLLMVFGAPNNWRLDSNGKLVKDYESDEYRAAVGFARDLWSAGAWHPDSKTLTGTTLSTALRGGQAVVASHSFGALIAQWSLLAAENPAARLRVIHPFSADGKTKPIYHTGPSNFGISFVKKGSDDRVKLLLRVLNYIASPFGSQEYTLLNYGVEGVHFNRDANGVPALTDKGRAEVLSTWKYITNNPQVLFSPDRSMEYATDIQTDEKAMADVAIPDPTLGYFSPTFAAQQALLDQAMNDGVNDIVVGRSALSDLDGLVTAWRTNGGDKSRGEYQDALAAAR
ncbi:MAG: extracellular solute-binding protein [Chloroflexi bacterium]|nr:extracellular solute-binding protein [Chloroflexota bacterium]MBV9892570.1 extracellular solute-binding protein [Chloroflexota bacterium]